jgi:phosphate transport system substrate-binding protein
VIRALPVTERTQYCQTVREDGAWIDVTGDYAVLYSRLVDNPRALGVLGFSFLAVNRDLIKAASIDGVLPTAETIAAWTYPLARPLFIYVKQAHVGLVPGLAEFVQEFVSDAAIGPRGCLVELGLMPLPAPWLQTERLKAQQLLRRAN